MLYSFQSNKREEMKIMKIFVKAVPDDLDDMIFLDEPWTHSER